MKISEQYALKIMREDRFENLVYLHITTEKSGIQPKWVARCDCGSLVLTVRGGARSCGCLREKTAAENGKKSEAISSSNITTLQTLLNDKLTQKQKASILGVCVETVRRHIKKLRGS